MQNPTRRSRDPDAGRPANGQRDRRDGEAAQGRGDDGRRAGGRGEEHRPRRLSGAAAVKYAQAQLLDLTGQSTESVSSLSRTRDGGWRVALEVVELERIPRTTDILASYVVELDDEGELMGYERARRYYRNEVSGEQ